MESLLHLRVFRKDHIMPLDDEELVTRFTYHPPKGDQTARYKALRFTIREAALLILESTVECREQSLAITHLEQASMWANAAIARRG